jgi:transposase
MAAPKSQDLRRRVIAAVEAGSSRRAAARRFQVGVKTAIEWVRQWHSQGKITPGKQGGDQRSHRIEAHHDFLMACVSAEPDITLEELQERLWKQHSCWVGIGALSRFFQRHGYSHKKRAPTLANKNAGM